MKKNLKKLFLILFVVVMAVVCFAFSAGALDTTGQCGDNVYWTFDESTGELVISGSGDMYDDYEYSDWFGDTSPFYNSNIKSVVINNGVTNIGDCMFINCSSLTAVYLSDSVTTIGSYAFKDCISLTSITIPNGITNIEDDAFVGCVAFECINVSKNNKIYSSDLNGVLFNKDKTKLLRCPEGTRMNLYAIPNSVTSIDSEAFENCLNITEITISDNVISIGANAFYNSGYYNNESNWKDKVLYIDNCLIQAKKDISGSYTIKNGTITIADNAFTGCKSLAGIIIPDSVITIGNEAFKYCSPTTI